MNTYIPDWSKYVGTNLLEQVSICPGDFLTIENSGWITGSWGRHRCVGCVIEDDIVWEADPITKVTYDPSATDFRQGCTHFYLIYNTIKVHFKRV